MRTTLAAIVAAALGLVACDGSGKTQRGRLPGPGGAADPAEATDDPAEGDPLERETVTLWFPSSTGDGLAGETREIFATSAPADRAKQIIADLIEGPATDAALPALPEGTKLRQIYVLDDGTAWADFSVELLAAIGEGSSEEIRTVFAIVDSIALNVEGIARVGILVEGRPCDGPGGHLNLRQPLRPDRSLPESGPGAGPPPSEDEPPKEAPPVDGAVLV